MSSTPSSIDKIVRMVLSFIRAENLDDSAISGITKDPSYYTESHCVVRRILAQPDSCSQCPPEVRESLKHFIGTGYTLLAEWPRSSGASVRGWLGDRLFLTHSANVSNPARLATIVCSQLGRDGRNLRNWPALLEAALRNIRMHRSLLLASPKTTLYASTVEIATIAEMRAVVAELPSESQSVDDWLAERLRSLTETSDDSLTTSQIFISPQLKTRERVRGDFKDTPLQDRIAVALADTIYALSVRPRGNLDALLRRRLCDSSFAEGSVFIHVDSENTGKRKSKHAPDWLDLGAVGWHITSSAHSAGVRLNQRCTESNKTLPVQQLCCHLSQENKPNSEDDWHFLSHCTRGTSGPMPGENQRAYYHRLWMNGQVSESHPMRTLHQICLEQKIRGTSRLTRTDHRCVSFSSVPLLELLERRKFNSHLGRWDWESYGLMIQQQALVEMGARRVIYGTENDYKSLGDDQRPFFQPFGKRNEYSPDGWAAEQEWRVVGDVDLNRLPIDSVRLFVREREEAWHLSRQFPWPVFWLKNTRDL